MRHPCIVTGLALIVAACGATNGADATTDQYATAGTVATLDGRLHVPTGFKVSYYSADVPGVRFMAIGPDGAVYASQPGQGRIIRLPDANHDGVADEIVVVASGLTQPHGLAFHKGALWVANTDGVVRIALGPTGIASGAPQYVNHYAGGGGHWSRTIVFGADSAMYVSVGSTCNLCVEQSNERAAVLRFNEDGSAKTVFASGLRNAVGLAVHPVTGELWASQNERDELPPDHQDLPPEEINIVRAGKDYGWPYCYGDRVPNPEYSDAARCASTVPPALKMQAHSAPLGMSFLTRATTFPDDYRGDLLVAFHGSWNRDTPTGAKVVRVHVANGVPTGVDDFITGWQQANGKRWGRPADVVVAADGSVLVSDDASGAIYRVSR
ncbi:MAG: PQQ-dependent sugar dehydrogenase [bacterium]